MKKLFNTKAFSLDAGLIHFIGIGGIGMSGIAEILYNLGYHVQGSDLSHNSNTKRLEKLGIKILIGQNKTNLKDAAVVVRSSAVKDNNPEVIEARKKNIPLILRAEMLAELMRLKTSIAVAGTHGKTTTTSIITSMFSAANLDPTVINGGIINAYGTNARLGSGDWLVAEADESDGTFLKLPATIGVVTNIDPEHMEHYGTFDNLKLAFRNFINNLPFYGFGVLCIDHPIVAELAEKITDRKIITYGITSQNPDVKATNIRPQKGGNLFDVIISKDEERILKDVFLPMPGIHNVSNALAAISVSIELGFSYINILEGLKDFKGVKRRFTKTGEFNGITIIDDYGHHPKEIAATLKTAKEVSKDYGGRVIAVVQPHRYSRVKDLFSEFCECFSDADSVVVANIYEAGEQPIEGINRDTLVQGIREKNQGNVIALNSPDELAKVIKETAKSKDIVVCLGAGNISLWANDLPNQLKLLG